MTTDADDACFDATATTIESPSLTIVIPTLNDVAGLPLVLGDLAAQTAKPHEIFVVDGGSEDGTLDVVERFGDLPIAVLHNPDRRVPHALNMALAKAEGDVLVRVDAKTRIGPRHLEQIVERFREDPGLGGVGGLKRADARTRRGDVIAKVLGSPYAVGGSGHDAVTRPTLVDHIPFGAYRTLVLRSVGGWNVDVAVDQDFELDQRLRQRGYRLLLDPRAEVRWRCGETLSKLAHQYFRFGQGRAGVMRLHPDSASLRQVVPALAVLAWLLAPVLAATLSSPWFLAAPALHLLTVLVTGRMIPAVRWRMWPVASAAVFAMQLGYGCGTLWNFASRIVPAARTASSSQVSPMSSV